MPYKNNADRRQKYSDNKEKKKKDAKNKRRRERRQNKHPDQKKEENKKRREDYRKKKDKEREEMENNTNQNEETMRTPSKVPSTPTAFTPIQSASKLAGMTPDRLSALKESTKRRRANIEWKKAQMKSLQEQTNSALKIVAGVREDSKTALGLVKEQTASVESTFNVQEALESDEQLIIIAEAEAEAVAEAEAEAAAEAEAKAEMRESKDGVKNLLTDFDNTDADGPTSSVRFGDNDTRFFNGESPPNRVRSPGKGILKNVANAFDRMIECFSPSSSEEGDDTNYFSPRSGEDRSGEDRSGEDVESNKPEESNNFEGYDDELAAAAKIPIDGAKVDDTVFENAPEVHGGTEESKEEIGNEDDSKEDDTGIKLEKPRRRRKKNYFQGRSPRRSLRFQKNKGTDQD